MNSLLSQSNDIQSKAKSYGNPGLYSHDQIDRPDGSFSPYRYPWCACGDGKVISCDACSTSRKITDQNCKCIDYPPQDKRAPSPVKGGISRVATEITIDADREPIKVCPIQDVVNG